MDGRRFDKMSKALASGASRRSALKGLAGSALGGAFALAGLRGTTAAVAACNTDEKCETKCGSEFAECCNGACVAGCGPNRARNPRTCECVRITRNGRRRSSGPNFCGA